MAISHIYDKIIREKTVSVNRNYIDNLQNKIDQILYYRYRSGAQFKSILISVISIS